MMYRIKQEHGLGDAVALTAILRHLRAREPDCRLELIVKPGRETLYDDGVDEVSSLDDLRRPPTHILDWPMANASHRHCPSTWVERCLIEQLGIMPVAELCRYQVSVRNSYRAAIRAWLEASMPGTANRGQRALCNFRGASFKERKDLSDYEAAAVALALEDAGYQVLIWDAVDRTELPEQGIGRRAPEDLVAGNAGMLAALIAETDLFVGVDSGPLHLASAIGAKAIGLWPRQSPLHCICHDDTTTHLIRKGAPEYERFLIHRPIDDGLAFFRAHYKHVWCDDFASALRGLV
jgi:ADP-heptose:LPS heptosyltransferase